VNETGFVIRKKTSLDLYNVEKETTILPMFIATKKMNNITSTKR
jgi:hypothetical protein